MHPEMHMVYPLLCQIIIELHMIEPFIVINRRVANIYKNVCTDTLSIFGI